MWYIKAIETWLDGLVIYNKDIFSDASVSTLILENTENREKRFILLANEKVDYDINEEILSVNRTREDLAKLLRELGIDKVIGLNFETGRAFRSTNIDLKLFEVLEYLNTEERWECKEGVVFVFGGWYNTIGDTLKDKKIWSVEGNILKVFDKFEYEILDMKKFTKILTLLR